MPGPAPKTREWSARENAHKPAGLHLIVNGLIQVTSTNQEPQLDESSERDPKHLGLTLTIKEAGGPGTQVVCWKAVRFHKEVTANQYGGVTIRWDASAIAQVPVVDDTEQGQAAAAMMAQINAKHAKAPAKPAPKGPAPKAKEAAPKKAAPKKAAPKKKAKKAAPKKAKKAKKAAKKAVAARVVRAVGGWAKGAKKALSRVIGTKKKSAKKPAKKAKKKIR